MEQENKEPQLRNITHGELLLMFTRLALDIADHPDNYVWGKTMDAGVNEFFRQENFRRDLIKK